MRPKSCKLGKNRQKISYYPHFGICAKQKAVIKALVVIVMACTPIRSWLLPNSPHFPPPNIGKSSNTSSILLRYTHTFIRKCGTFPKKSPMFFGKSGLFFKNHRTFSPTKATSLVLTSAFSLKT